MNVFNNYITGFGLGDSFVFFFLDIDKEVVIKALNKHLHTDVKPLKLDDVQPILRLEGMDIYGIVFATESMLMAGSSNRNYIDIIKIEPETNPDGYTVFRGSRKFVTSYTVKYELNKIFNFNISDDLKPKRYYSLYPIFNIDGTDEYCTISVDYIVNIVQNGIESYISNRTNFNKNEIYVDSFNGFKMALDVGMQCAWYMIRNNIDKNAALVIERGGNCG